MKSYFTRLFDYDRYANELIIEAISKVTAYGKPAQLMGHLLAAKQVWLNRCLDLPASAVDLWPSLGVDTSKLADMTDAVHQAWLNYLNELEEADFEQIIYYQNTKGDNYQNRLSDILAHVINHGTHHRAQAGQHLKANGTDLHLPITDYIFYLRQPNN